MSVSSKSIDVSFLLLHGFTFSESSTGKSIRKVKFEDKTLACKITKQKKKDDKDKRLEILKLISHPNIVAVHSIFQNGKFAFIFMQWSDGGDLLNYIKANGALKESKANVWFYQLVCAIKYLHSMKLAHCNLRCESVMISNVNVKISCLNHIQPNEEKIIQISSQSVPAFYLPPDANKGIPCDAMKFDVFALGVILFMMINAAVPYVDENLPQLIDDQVNRKFAMRASLTNSLSVECQAMIHTLLEPNEEIRWRIDKVYKMKWLSKFIDKHGDC